MQKVEAFFIKLFHKCFKHSSEKSCARFYNGGSLLQSRLSGAFRADCITCRYDFVYFEQSFLKFFVCVRGHNF